MDGDRQGIDFACKYPFSSEARELIAHAAPELEDKFIKAGKIRVEEDLNSSSIPYYKTSLQEIKYTYVISYVYSRMLISAINSKVHLERYILAEAQRSRSALEEETMPNILKLLSELGIEMSYSGGRFIIGFSKFLALSPRSPGLELVKEELDRGLVYLQKDSALKLMENAIADEIRKNLPIPAGDLPKRIIEESKKIKTPKINTRVDVREGSYRWIEKLLSNPISDVRHRTVNLVLAPYLVNIKGLGEDQAAEIILEYIERCRQVNPDTRINSSYIKYQCRYAKSKGLKPLSLEKARDLYSGVLELD
ncbi:MAG: DNA primase noncatalytic subunit PriX [Candidatus Micrarchaeaceae archaeon]